MCWPGDPKASAGRRQLEWWPAQCADTSRIELGGVPARDQAGDEPPDAVAAVASLATVDKSNYRVVVLPGLGHSLREPDGRLSPRLTELLASWLAPVRERGGK